MATQTNNALLQKMAIDIEIIKKAIEPLPQMYKDIYIGNGDPAMRETCREYEAEKKEKKDDNKWFKRSVFGVIVAQSIGLVFAMWK